MAIQVHLLLDMHSSYTPCQRDGFRLASCWCCKARLLLVWMARKGRVLVAVIPMEANVCCALQLTGLLL